MAVKSEMSLNQVTEMRWSTVVTEAIVLKVKCLDDEEKLVVDVLGDFLRCSMAS